MSDQQSSDQHTREGQVERAKRLRAQIENLKSGQRPAPPGAGKSLREQIAERAEQIRERDQSGES
jgi:hypothetical protein